MLREIMLKIGVNKNPKPKTDKVTEVEVVAITTKVSPVFSFVDKTLIFFYFFSQIRISVYELGNFFSWIDNWDYEAI